MDDNTLSDIAFIPSVNINIKGDVPNPMTFNVPTNVSITMQFIFEMHEFFRILYVYLSQLMTMMVALKVNSLIL